MENNTTRYGLLGDAKRLGEILSVANKYKVTQGLTPDKVYNMFKDLGTAFIKLGQLLSLHPEVLPKEYCKALENLRNDAPTITTAQIREIVSEEYGKPWNHVFSKIVVIPVGSASIAQVHDAYLLDGTRVAIKVQRPDSYQMMEQDVRMLKKALNVLKIPQIKKILWLINNALDETWRVAQEELNFIQEAENLERLAKILEPMEFAHVPAVYKELTTRDVLVMEYIDGYEITDHEGLIAAGYDLSEICQKLIRSYIKQWAEDLFFQADPHSGNICIRDGQIVLCGQPGDHPCRESLQQDYIAFLDKYRVQSIKEMNETGDVFVDMINIMAKYGAEFPLSLTMYGRSLLVMEGTVSNLDEKTDLTDILGRHLAAYAIGDGPAGKIARKLSHNRLCSGSRLHYNEYQTKEEVPKDSELLSEEEYRILSETGAKVWSPENE